MSVAYHKATTLPEAIALCGMHGRTMAVLAGGTDLIVQWRTGAITPSGFIDISNVAELKVIVEADDDMIEIGAGATHAQIATSDIIRTHAPILAEACRSIGAVQIQNRGTIGGNVMNASPAGDAPPVFMALEADFKVQDIKGERWILAENFFTGYRRTALRPGELLTAVRIRKRRKEELQRFFKVGTRRAQAISKVVLAVNARISHGGVERIAIAVGSVAPITVRAPGTEALLRGKAITTALIGKARRSLADEVTPIDDVRSTADYRRHICGTLIARFLKEITAASSKRA